MKGRWRCTKSACPCLAADFGSEEVIHDVSSLDQVFYMSKQIPDSPGATSYTFSGSESSPETPLSIKGHARAVAVAGAWDASPYSAGTSCSSVSSQGKWTSPMHGEVRLCERKTLDLLLAPGDVLVIKGTDRLSQVGAAGGFAGHVALTVSKPILIHRDSPEADDITSLWPELNIWPLWRLSALESTRLTAGIHAADLLLHVDDATGQIELIGEHNPSGCIEYERESTSIWQVPEELRKNFQYDLMAELVEDMIDVNANWCWATAARAFLLPAAIPDDLDPVSVLHEAQEGWASEPICTSVVVAFWQRYLCGVAETQHVASERRSRRNHCRGISQLIMKWMPLRADRTLPKDLLDAFVKCGWKPILKVPMRKSL